MRALVVSVACVAALLIGVACAVASDNVGSNTGMGAMMQKTLEAKREQSAAQAALDRVVQDVDLGRASPDKGDWRQLELKWNNDTVAGPTDPKVISAEIDTLNQMESRLLKSSDHERMAQARNDLMEASAKVEHVLSQYNQAVRSSRTHHDDFSQATQPENRTQNGSNFSIRSQRDSENHPPLPSSQ
jgi:hypothetical protein